MANKVTKRDNFGAIAEILKGLGREDLEQVMIHEIELLDKKAGKAKATKNQVENNGIKDIILEELARIGTPVTITELLNKSEIVAEKTNKSNQKTSALMTQLKDTHQVVRMQDKKVARFRLATDTDVFED